jgi:uncharacterized protein
MIRVIIDTNVLVSAVLRGRAPQAVILFVAEQPDFEWVASDAIVREYKTVLSRPKFGLPPTLLQRWFTMIDTLTTLVSVTSKVDLPRDPKDAKFLECALDAQAHYFITGDLDFTGAQKLVQTTILSVTLFQRLVMAGWEDHQS